MSCEICGNKPMNCDCTQEARELYYLREQLAGMKELQEETERLGLYGLSEKQRERREFIAQHLHFLEFSNFGEKNEVRFKRALGIWNMFDKQLTELEKGEG